MTTSRVHKSGHGYGVMAVILLVISIIIALVWMFSEYVTHQTVATLVAIFFLLLAIYAQIIKLISIIQDKKI